MLRLYSFLFAITWTALTKVLNPEPALGGIGDFTCDAIDVVHTELGDICANPSVLFQQIIQILVGVAGGICLLLLIGGTVKYILSSGNPEAVEEAKGIITQAVTGILLVILSVFVVRFIGIDLLGLPGLEALINTGGFEGR